ncbi:MAG TPA: hypothetical protein VLZ06_08980 [Solirubrobacteraceae bacterium]|nr:hypothetical protein [Solirubrobacteraceae bacterium]
MIYCVVPRALEGELFDKLTEYYRDDDNVEVIVERRQFDRRARRGRAEPAMLERRVIRDRRRARVAGDTLPLAHA